MKRKEIEAKIHEMSTFLSSGGGFGDPDALRDHLLKIEELKHREKMLNDRQVLYIAIGSLVVATISLLVSIFK
ncbi:hypothetical protein LJB99_02845 [Deltaproteobacteria bacterium OttesenSCG-928-K17]|nr:hypothetical protein [Deltaproteobacteria bacterium OttesenSCG-928-K17]